MSNFPAALTKLQDALPRWWQTRNPAAQIYILLAVLAAMLDQLSAAMDDWWNLRSIATASEQQLVDQYAYLYGVQNEQLPPTSTALRPYIQALAAYDGSKASMIVVLMTLLTADPANSATGPILTFPSSNAAQVTGQLGAPSEEPGRMQLGGASHQVGATDPGHLGAFDSQPGALQLGGGPAPQRGLTFPADGSGLTLWELAPGQTLQAGLTFPPDGSGLTFPELPDVIGQSGVGVVTVPDGSTPLGAGTGLTFALNGYLTIIEDPTEYKMTVQVKNWLAFDRRAFRRAVQRLQMAHCLPAVIQEVP